MQLYFLRIGPVSQLYQLSLKFIHFPVFL